MQKLRIAVEMAYVQRHEVRCFECCYSFWLAWRMFQGHSFYT